MGISMHGCIAISGAWCVKALLRWRVSPNATSSQVSCTSGVHRWDVCHLGSGKYNFNDCLGCMLRKPKVQSRCAQRPFITLTDKNGSFKCNFVGKEHVLRGMYGPQLAWWFTLFHPSQFKIINSKQFFKVCTGHGVM